MIRAVQRAVSEGYFDGQCPLCRFEMDHLRRWADDSLELVDIHDVEPASLPDRETLLGVLHLRTADGDWLRGIDASVRAWQATRVGWLWSVLRLPLIAPVADRAYAWWARRRFERLYGRDCPAKEQV